jgi:hypothetical protein
LIRHRDSPDMGKTAMPWYDQSVYQPPDMERWDTAAEPAGVRRSLVSTGCSAAESCVLSNQISLHASPIGWTILEKMPLTTESGTVFVREVTGLGFASRWISKRNAPSDENLCEFTCFTGGPDCWASSSKASMTSRPLAKVLPIAQFFSAPTGIRKCGWN